jgi:hypothetical protein
VQEKKSPSIVCDHTHKQTHTHTHSLSHTTHTNTHAHTHTGQEVGAPHIDDHHGQLPTKFHAHRPRNRTSRPLPEPRVRPQNETNARRPQNRTNPRPFAPPYPYRLCGRLGRQRRSGQAKPGLPCPARCADQDACADGEGARLARFCFLLHNSRPFCTIKSYAKKIGEEFVFCFLQISCPVLFHLWNFCFLLLLNVFLTDWGRTYTYNIFIIIVCFCSVRLVRCASVGLVDDRLRTPFTLRLLSWRA